MCCLWRYEVLFEKLVSTSNVSIEKNKNTKAIIPVHLYGHPVDIDPILMLAKDRSIIVIVVITCIAVSRPNITEFRRVSSEISSEISWESPE